MCEGYLICAGMGQAVREEGETPTLGWKVDPSVK